MTLPPFQEPDWSQLPKEAVAWAVDENGCAYTYGSVPACDPGPAWFMGGTVTGAHGIFDLTGIDWRTTLRLRPKSDLQAAQGSPQFTAQIQRDAEGVEPKSDLELDEHTKLCRRTELEFIAQEFMKALLANPGNFGRSAWPVIDMAYEAARAFIDEREKRRLP